MGIPADGSDVSTEFLSWGSTPFESIADAQAMDRQYDGSWGIDLVGYGRLAAVAKDGHLKTQCDDVVFSKPIWSYFEAHDANQCP